MPNVDIKPQKPITPFRKIAIGTWQTAYDPSIYGTLRLRADKAMEYIDKFREKTGKKLTFTHLVTKAVALSLKACPDANAILRWNRIYIRQQVDISMLVLIKNNGRMDLSATKLEKVDEIGFIEMIDTIQKNVDKIRKRKDKSLEKTRQTMRRIPSLFINFFLKMIAFFAYTLNLNMKWAGIPKDPFGGAIVTSIGSIGLDIGYVPIVPYSRVPIYVAPGEVHKEPVVEDDKIVPGQIININATFDHRVVDGGHASILADTMRKVIEHPFDHLENIDSLPSASESGSESDQPGEEPEKESPGTKDDTDD